MVPVLPSYVEGGWHEHYDYASNQVDTPCFARASDDFTFWLVFWAPSPSSLETEGTLAHTVGVWREKHHVGALRSLSECLRGLVLRRSPQQRPVSEPRSVCVSDRMQWALARDSDPSERHAFTEVEASAEDASAAERVGARLPGLSVRLVASYELAAGREWLPGDYAPVLTNPGLARADTSGPFAGFTSLDLFDADFMCYAQDMRWHFGGGSEGGEPHGLFRGETLAEIESTMSEYSADCEDSRANIRLDSVVGRVEAGLGGRPCRPPVSWPSAGHGPRTPRVAEGVVELLRFRIRPAPC